MAIFGQNAEKRPFWRGYPKNPVFGAFRPSRATPREGFYINPSRGAPRALGGLRPRPGPSGGPSRDPGDPRPRIRDLGTPGPRGGGARGAVLRDPPGPPGGPGRRREGVLHQPLAPGPRGSRRGYPGPGSPGGSRKGPPGGPKPARAGIPENPPPVPRGSHPLAVQAQGRPP